MRSSEVGLQVYIILLRTSAIRKENVVVNRTGTLGVRHLHSGPGSTAYKLYTLGTLFSLSELHFFLL